MIGNISLGKSFFHCISYCLEDKRQLTEEEKHPFHNLKNYNIGNELKSWSIANVSATNTSWLNNLKM